MKSKGAVHEERREKGDTQQVVPVKVGEQDIFIEPLRSPAAEHTIAKPPQAAAPIQHDAPSFCLNFNARSLPSEVQILALWSGDGASHSPEGNVHFLVRHFTAWKMCSIAMGMRGSSPVCRIALQSSLE